MHTPKFLRKALKPLALLAAIGIALPLLTATPAGADPKQFSALIAMGSDTTQSIMEAFAGESNGVLYLPIKSSSASGNRQIANWVAAAPGIPSPIDCITPKAPGATIVRPVGSTNGRRALSRAILNEKWGGPNCGTLDASGKNPSGLIHIARSSSGPSTGSDLAYLPFARDALAFAYYKNGGGPVTTLTFAQLQTIFTTTGAGPSGSHPIGGVNILGCGIQTGSGTYKDWNTALAMNATTEAVGTATCNAAGSGVRVEEHDSDGLKAKGDALGSNFQVIVGMGTGPFISQWNGVAVDRTDPAVDLGIVSDEGGGVKSYNGTIGTIPAGLSANATYYGDAPFGRTVYNVIDNAIVTGPAGANQDFKTLLVSVSGSTPVICATGVGSAQERVNLFGFLSLSSGCGVPAAGAFITGNLPTS